MFESQAVGSPCRDTVTRHVERRILRSCLARGFWKQTEAGPSTLFLVGLLAHQTCRGHGDPRGWDSLCVCSARRGGEVFLIEGRQGGAGGSAPRAPHTSCPALGRLCSIRVGGTGVGVLAGWRGVGGRGRRIRVMGAGRGCAWSDEDVLGRVTLWKAGLFLSTILALLPGPL